MESFLEINFISIPRNHNQVVDALGRKGACFTPIHHKRGSHGVKFLCRPYVPDTANYW